MFTARKIGHTDDVQTQRRIVVIQFTDGVTEYSKPFSFRLTDTVDVMKKAVSSYLNEINAVAEVIPDNTSDFTVPDTTPAPTQAELKKTEWLEDRAKLRTLMELVRDGVFVGDEAQITALQTKVRTGFKVAYLG